MIRLKVYTDGGARGNPGPAGIGAVIFDDNDKELIRIAKYIGENTNNQAEYMALIEALKWIIENYNDVEVILFLDSELVVKQLQGLYKIKNEGLKPHYLSVQNLTSKLNKVNFNHIPREQNKIADQLVNIAIDKALSK